MLSVNALLIPNLSNVLHLVQSAHISFPTVASNPSDNSILLLLNQLLLIVPYDGSANMNSLPIFGSQLSSIVLPQTTDHISFMSEQICDSKTIAEFLPWAHDMESSVSIISQPNDQTVSALFVKAHTSLNDRVNVLRMQPYHEILIGNGQQLLDSLRGILYVEHSLVAVSSLHPNLDALTPSSATTTFNPLPADAIGAIIKEFIAAPGRAASSFIVQLSQKGDILVANTHSSLNYFTTSLPKVVATSWDGALVIITNGVSKFSSSVQPIKDAVLATNDVLNSLASAINAKVMSIGRGNIPAYMMTNIAIM